MTRLLSSSDDSELDTKTDATESSKTHQPSCRVRADYVEQKQTQRKTVLPQRLFKVVFLGSAGVGKTSFIQHYCTGRFCSNMSSTTGIDYQMKTLTLNATTVTLQLWDTAGQERYRSITQQYYRKADGVLAMYDVTHPASFIAVRGWMDSVKEKTCEGTVLMLVGNKLDLTDRNRRKVSAIEGQRLADQYQALFHECSVKTGHNMDELMNRLAGMLVTKHDQQLEDAILLTENAAEQRGCCTCVKK